MAEISPLIKEIRSCSGLSQVEMADWLGVTFATVNRWENGHGEPGKTAQYALHDFCDAHGVPLAEMTISRIQQQSEALAEPRRLILFHGSKEGLKGEIKPNSRRQCDFGQGFYMGNDVRQALCRVADFNEPVLYVISLDTAGLELKDIKPDIDWALTVAYNRGKMKGFELTKCYRKYSAMAEGKDLLIGSIANDRMFYVLDNFFQGNLTDAALVASLKTLDLGKQYVALSHKACEQIKIEKEIRLTIVEQLAMRNVSMKLRKEGAEQAREICRQFRREGRYFDEIINDQK